MSSGERMSHEALAVRCGMAVRALTGHADRDHQTLRAACAMVLARKDVSLFLGDMLRAPCEKAGGDPLSDDPKKDRAAEHRKTCAFQYRGNWREWCWPCRARQIVLETEL